MSRRSPLPQTSRCSRPAPRPVSLSDARILRALFAFAVVAALCVAHVSLRFKTLDLRVQHRQLQEQSRKLSRQEQELLRRTRMLAEDILVREAARSSLNMRDLDPRAAVVASVPAHLVEKYATPSAAERAGESALAAALPSPRATRSSLADALVSFVDISRAQAAGSQP